jgi:hypothetical protein
MHVIGLHLIWSFFEFTIKIDRIILRLSFHFHVHNTIRIVKRYYQVFFVICRNVEMSHTQCHSSFPFLSFQFTLSFSSSYQFISQMRLVSIQLVPTLIIVIEVSMFTADMNLSVVDWNRRTCYVVFISRNHLHFLFSSSPSLFDRRFRCCFSFPPLIPATATTNTNNTKHNKFNLFKIKHLSVY